MIENNKHSDKKYPLGEYPDLPAPQEQRSVKKWLQENLFSTWYNSILTVLFVVLLGYNIPQLLDWMIFKADFYPASRDECTSGGACWGVITRRMDQYLYGFYPAESHWRPNLAFVLLIGALLPVLWKNCPHRQKAFIFSLIYPFIAYWLLFGGLGLDVIESEKIGGLMLTLTLGVMGIALSLPLGILLALGRRSEMPAVRFLSVVYIEFIRGVPMISLLFMATVLMPLFLPSDRAGPYKLDIQY